MSFIITEGALLAPQKVEKEYKSGKVIFETYLQEAETPNDNHRIYGKEDLSYGISKIADRIKKRQLTGELDHPISDNPIRQTTVLYKESSHVFTRLWWEGNMLKGLCETLPYLPNGKGLSGLVRDRIPVGFSLRGLADVVDNGGGYKKIKGPIIIITYDCVSKPSNNKALISEIKQESVQILRESVNTICTSDGVCYLPNYFDMLVEQKVINLKKKYW